MMPGLVLAQATQPIEAPSIAYRSIAPMLIVFSLAIVGVLIEAFADAEWRQRLQLPVAIAGLVGAFAATAVLWQDETRQLVARDAVVVDGPALFLQGTLLALTGCALLLLGDRGDPADPDHAVPRSLPTESYPLAMFSLGGMMLFVSANNLLVLFLALEVLSLPLYLLCGLARRRRILSQESAVKYFLLGAYSSAFFLYGVALVYGFAGTVSYAGIFAAASRVGGGDLILFAGLALLGVGLLFKIGAVPFHSWTPDVYEGAPTPITALMAAGTKVAAFGGLFRLMYVCFAPMRWDWRPAIWAVAILTMVVGAVIAVTQTDVKRMLAYSSIAHAGFILTALGGSNQSGLRGALFYLLAYGFAVIGAFGIVTLVRDADGEATHLSRWQGLGRRSPLVAGAFALFLFALAGIPLTSGFVAKFTVFEAAVSGGATTLVVVGVLSSAIAAFFYARVVVLMFFQEPVDDGPEVVIPSPVTAAALGLALAVTVLLGVLPGQLLRLADDAGRFLR